MPLRDKLGDFVVKRDSAGDLLLDREQDVDVRVTKFLPGAANRPST